MIVGQTYVRKYVQDPLNVSLPKDEDYELEEALVAVAAFASANTPSSQLNFSTLKGEVDEKGVPQVSRVDYEYAPRIGGPLNITMPDYEARDVTKQSCQPSTSSDLKMNVFKFCTAGVDGPARKILSGDYPTTDETIQRYYRARRQNELDEMPLSEISSLAHSILAETGRSSDAQAQVADGTTTVSFSVVGGPDQLGVFPSRGKASCCGGEHLPIDQQLLPPKFIRAGLSYDGTENGSPVNAVRISFDWNELYDPDEPIHQVFIGDYFRNVIVRLDGNYFVNNRFDNVTFHFEGGECFMPSGNQLGPNCKMARSPFGWAGNAETPR